MLDIDLKFIKSLRNKSEKPIIIVPKKVVKLAVNRNKIKRQIRNILQLKQIKKCIVKYKTKENKPNFNELKDIINSKIEKNN